MSNIIYFPLDIRYCVDSICRDGRIIVQILHSSTCFIMYPEHILANAELIRCFPKAQVGWLCDLVTLTDSPTKNRLFKHQ